MRTHLARARLMVLRAGILAHGTGPIFIAQEGILRARCQRSVIQSHIVLGHGTGIGEGQRDLDTFDENRHIHRIAQIVAPDDRLRKGIVTDKSQFPCGSQVRNLLATVNRRYIDCRNSEFHESPRAEAIDQFVEIFPAITAVARTSWSYHSRVKLGTEFWP